LQSFLRADDPEERPAFYAISKYNLARSDLVPLIITYPDDAEVVYNACEPHRKQFPPFSIARSFCPHTLRITPSNAEETNE
jgi:hypothetical protein